jgi:hypothetical protein
MVYQDRLRTSERDNSESCCVLHRRWEQEPADVRRRHRPLSNRCAVEQRVSVSCCRTPCLERKHNHLPRQARDRHTRQTEQENVLSDDFKTMVQLWKAHGHTLCEEFHKTLDSRPFTLTHGDSSSSSPSPSSSSSSSETKSRKETVDFCGHCFPEAIRPGLCVCPETALANHRVSQRKTERKGCCCGVAFLRCIFYITGDLRADNLFRLGATAIYILKVIIYQDRLGTNIGKTQKKRGVSLGANGEATAFKIIDWQTYSSAPPGADMTQMVRGRKNSPLNHQ